jgi:hypothetical protein
MCYDKEVFIDKLYLLFLTIAVIARMVMPVSMKPTQRSEVILPQVLI